MRVLEFFLHIRLNDMGWPRKKGIFRRQYVDAYLADTTIEQGLMMATGLEAARPEIAVSLLTDTFAGNPWTEQSVSELMDGLREAADVVARQPDMPPWQALWQQFRLASYASEWRWSDLFNDNLGLIRARAGTQAVYWGLSNHDRMEEVFDREKSDYEASAIIANDHGLGVSGIYPFQSLDQLYETCDDLVQAFHETMSPLPPFNSTPPVLRAVPEIAQRL